MDIENGKFCLHCAKPLVNKQAKYCSDNHRQAFKRSQKKDQTSDHTTDSNHQTPGNALALFEEIKRDLARAEGMNVTLESERDSLRSERDKALDAVQVLERENGVLQGKLEAREESGSGGRVLWVFAALAALLVVLVIVMIVLQYR